MQQLQSCSFDYNYYSSFATLNSQKALHPHFDTNSKWGNPMFFNPTNWGGFHVATTSPAKSFPRHAPLEVGTLIHPDVAGSIDITGSQPETDYDSDSRPSSGAMRAAGADQPEDNADAATSPVLTLETSTVTMEQGGRFSLGITVQNRRPGGSSSNLIVGAQSSRPDLLPNTRLMVDYKTPTTRTLRILPTPFLSGSATVTVTVFDGLQATTANLMVSINNTLNTPQIVMDPSNFRGTNGSSAEFAVIAKGQGPFAYAWQASMDNGSTFANLPSLPGFSDFHNGFNKRVLRGKISATVNNSYFRCMVTDKNGHQVFTLPAKLSLGAPHALPVITQQPPLTASAPANSSVELLVGATSENGNLSYQWRRNGVVIPGATNNTLVVTVTSATVGHYEAWVSNQGGTVPSAATYVSLP
jgi:hypothetical protein